MFLDAEKIPNADPGSFVNLEKGYSKDKNHVYFHREIVDGVDPSQFRKINDDLNDFGFRDETRVFVGAKFVEGADPDTFRIEGEVYRDKKNVYWLGRVQKEIDVSSFKYLGLGYGKDNKRVYQFGSQGGGADGKLTVLVGADAATFEIISGASGLTSVPTSESLRTPDAKDKNNQFRNGKVLSPDSLK